MVQPPPDTTLPEEAPCHGRDAHPPPKNLASTLTVHTRKRPFLLCLVELQRTRAWVVGVLGAFTETSYWYGGSVKLARMAPQPILFQKQHAAGFRRNRFGCTLIATDVVHACWTAFTVYTSSAECCSAGPPQALRLPGQPRPDQWPGVIFPPEDTLRLLDVRDPAIA